MKNLILFPIIGLIALLAVNRLNISGGECALAECSQPEKKEYSCKEPSADTLNMIAVDSVEDEWSDLTGSGTGVVSDEDEFEDFGAANSLSAPEEISENKSAASADTHSFWLKSTMIWVYVSLIVTILAGIMLHYPSTRKFRNFFLLGSVIVFGFLKGGCACPIMGVYELAIWIHGGTAKIHSLIWFIGIAAISYFTGKVYCGWICHLGAVQEYIYLGNRFPALKGVTAQKTLKAFQIASFIGFISYAFLTKTNLYCKIEPFLVVFNLFSVTVTGWILFGILMTTTVLIYRPFCRGFCPLGLILGWISLLPGAKKIIKDNTCIGCSSCSEVCGHQAITRTVIDEEEGIYNVTFIPHECNACGDCMDVCGKDSISFCSKIKDKETVNLEQENNND